MRNNPLYRVFRFYYEGFTNMHIGKTLWTVILIKLFIIFAVLKLFFFPDHVKENAPGGDEAGYVATQLEQRLTDR